MLTKAEHRPNGRTRGVANVQFTDERLVNLEQVAPYRILRPSGNSIGTELLVLANISGGLVGGDELLSHVCASGSSKLMVTGQAAEKAYRCPQTPAKIKNHYEAHDNAWIEILPKELIMFEGARVTREYELRVTGSAQLLCGDITILGRTHSGETIQTGDLTDIWKLYANDQLLYLDAQDLDFSGHLSTLRTPACLSDSLAFGNIIYTGAMVDVFVQTCREVATSFASLLGLTDAQLSSTQLTASGFEEYGIARLLSSDAADLLKVYDLLWCKMRARLANLPATLPTLWSL